MDSTLSIAKQYTLSHSCKGIAYDGNYLWVCDRNKIYKHNLDSTLSLVASYDSPGEDPIELAWDGNNLWSCDLMDTHKIYKHNMDTTLSVAATYSAPGNPPWPGGLTWDGVYFWSSNCLTDKIYKLNSEQ